MAHTLPVECFSPNKSSSYLSLCISPQWDIKNLSFIKSWDQMSSWLKDFTFKPWSGLHGFTSNSLKPLWLLRVLGYQSLLHTSLQLPAPATPLHPGKSSIYLMVVAEFPVGLLHITEWILRQLSPQLPENTFWLEGVDVPCSLELNKSISISLANGFFRPYINFLQSLSQI